MFEKQLEFIQFLHQARTPFLDGCMCLLDFFDRQEFLFILLPLIWLGFSWTMGLRIFYLLSLNHVVNFHLKRLFALPRPFHLDPSVGLIQVDNYGFPSGAAQTAFLLSGLLCLYLKTPWRWGIAISYILLISFSRIYLGVHFPIDILGGWLVGCALCVFYTWLFPPIERFFGHRSPLGALLVSYVVLLAAWVGLPSKTMTSICACGMGLGLGVFISYLRLLPHLYPRTLGRFCLRTLGGIGGVFALYGLILKVMPGHSTLKSFLLFFSIGLWISLVVPYLSHIWEERWKKES